MPLAFFKVLRWLRRNWWVPAVFVLLVVGFVLGGFAFRRRDGVRAIDPFRDIRRLRRKHDEKLDAKEAQAKMERDRRIAEIESEHAETLSELDEDQKRRAEGLRRNPERLARWLNSLTDDG